MIFLSNNQINGWLCKMCSVKNCKGPNEMIYYGKYICFDCYNKHCQNKINLKELFKIEEEPEEEKGLKRFF